MFFDNILENVSSLDRTEKIFFDENVRDYQRLWFFYVKTSDLSFSEAKKTDSNSSDFNRNKSLIQNENSGGKTEEIYSEMYFRQAAEVGIAGAGLMGCAITTSFLRAGCKVVVYDLSETVLNSLPDRILTEWELYLMREQANARNSEAETELEPVSFALEPLKRDEIRSIIQANLFVTRNLSDLGQCSTIIETILEKKKVKQKFYRQLLPFCNEETVLMTNTSTIRVDELCEHFSEFEPSDLSQNNINNTKSDIETDNNSNINKEENNQSYIEIKINSCNKKQCKNEKTIPASRFCGFHFFHPVRKRSLVEIIVGNKTSEKTVQKAVSLAACLEKESLCVNDGPGFLVNRLLNPYLNESLALLEEGMELSRIESVCQKFGMEMGPFRIMDEIGLDVALHGGWTFYQAFPQRVASTELLPEMVRSGRLGRKNGRGFFRYNTQQTFWESPGESERDFDDFLKEYRKRRNIDPSLTKMSDEEMARRIFLAVLLEGFRIAEDGIVRNGSVVSPFAFQLPNLSQNTDKINNLSNPRMEKNNFSIFSEMDKALVLGLGFPRTKGGLFFLARFWGQKKILDWLEPLKVLGERFVPPDNFLL